MLAAAAAMTFAMTACQKDIFEEPFTSLSPVDAFNSPERIEKAAVGMYDQLQNPNYLGGRVLIYGDVRGTDIDQATYFDPLPRFTTVLANNSTVAGAWQGAYRTIGETNLFLANLAAKQSIVSAAKNDQYVGEAKFIRSLSYFYLVNLFAQPYKFTAAATHPGVPLVLTSANDPFASSNSIARSTVAEVYNQMEQDLLEAETKLPVDHKNPGFSDVARATKGAAQALLMRLYLYKGDYAKANTYADKVIASGKYGLNAAPETAFRTFTTKESIFSVAHNGGDNPNTNNALGQHYSPSKRGDISVSSNFVALMDSTDTRLNLITQDKGSYWTTKFLGVADWVPVMRYSEVLLTKAEALANLSAGVDADAVNLLNAVRGRAKASVLAPATKPELIDAILTERKIELAFEGQGSFDYLRTGRGIPAHGSIAAQAYGSNYVIFPIPKYDTDKNNKLVQNPGY